MRLISFISAIIIFIINFLLKKAVRYLTFKERHESYSDYNLSVAIKLTILRFINTSIVPVIANIHSDKWFIEGGLVSDMLSIILIISFINPLM